MKNKLYIIAEIGSVHDGSFGNACKLIELASKLGANAVKFQTHFGEAESLKSAKSPSYFKDEDRISYFNRTGFTFEQYKKFISLAKKNNVDFLCSPFSLEAVDFLEKLKIKAYKIPSGEVTNLPLLEKIYKTKKKVFLSTGMSNWKEINEALKTLKNKNNIVLMQCTSIYPCPNNKVGINVIQEMIRKYKIPVGFSDHTTGFVAAIGAIFNGANVVEKHLTFSKFMYGSDAFNALEPNDFKYFCFLLRQAFEIREYQVNKNDLSNLKNTKKIFEKSIVVSKNINKNSIIKLSDLAFKKPGDGISAALYKKILGKKINKNLKINDKFKYSDFKENKK
jgi:N,N'-diacetyllegionaminate synthase